jgi:hypothetical protein
VHAATLEREPEHVRSHHLRHEPRFSHLERKTALEPLHAPRRTERGQMREVDPHRQRLSDPESRANVAAVD